MAIDSGFAKKWEQYTNFEFVSEEQRKFSNYCAPAQQFAQWAENLVVDVGDSLSLLAIQQAKVQLLDKYFEWRAYVPKSHRDRLGASGHYCIFQVFASAYDTL